MENKKISARPPNTQSSESFILGANKPNKHSNNYQEEQILPWLNEKVRSDVQKVFTVKLPEEYILKIKHISDITNKSQQKIVREIIQKEVDLILLTL